MSYSTYGPPPSKASNPGSDETNHHQGGNNGYGQANSYQREANSYQGEANSYQGEANSYSHQGDNAGYGYSQNNNNSYGSSGAPPSISDASKYAKQYSKQNPEDDDSDDDEDRKESLFSSILAKVNPPAQVDENETQRAAQVHDQVYNQSSAGQVNSRDLGSAAAMQAFKMFSGSNNQGGSSQLIGLAMGEATKLFKSQKGNQNVNQNEMLQSAISMAMQLFMKQGSSQNNNSGGLGAVMGLLGSMGAPPPQQQPKPSGVAGLLGKFF